MDHWRCIKQNFNRDYGLMYIHLNKIPTDFFDDVRIFRYKWYTARAYRRMLGNDKYDDYKVKYEEVIDAYPNYAEPIYELCQHSPTMHQRYELYKKCLSCTIEVDDSEVLEWKALCGFLVECYNLEKYDEAYDAWVKLLKNYSLEKIRDKYRDWITHVKKCGMLVTEKINETSSYAQFRSELVKIRKAIVTHNMQNMQNIRNTYNIHLVWVKGYREYSMIQYLAVRAAYELQVKERQSCICIYNDIEPENNEWWEKTKEYASIVHVTPPKYINGKYVPHPQHIADIMRICIIYEFGGMYIDTDLLLIKSVHELIQSLDKYVFSHRMLAYDGTLNSSHPKDDEFSNVIMCKETNNKIWNGLIIAKPYNSFLRRWIREYETKYGDSEGGCWWAGLSVETPMRLYKDDSTDVILLDTHTFLPFGFYNDGIYKMGYNEHPYPLSYGVHLWETEAEKRGVLPKNKEWFESNKDTIFAHLFGKYV